MPHRLTEFIDGWDVVLLVAITAKWIVAFIMDIDHGISLAIGLVSLVTLIVGGMAKWEQVKYYRKKNKGQ